TQEDELLLRSLWKNPADKTKQIQQIIKRVGLHKDLKTYVTDLSYGQRKLLDLAIAMAKPHDLLMLDEPVAGVNPLIRKEIKAILKQLKKQGETIFVIEHDMNFVMDIADHVIVMDAGKVIAEGKPKQIQKNKKVLEAYLGE
ncbi:MAG: ATP-binding cassette domain-containing protein, partial [Candidatus Woesearchaeota archaeon]|nr:ATP-binding cassette domain-containing protein [Candidatus Woesearchaeota archaeon]